MTQQQEYHQQPQQVSTTALVTINFKETKKSGTPTISSRSSIKEDANITKDARKRRYISNSKDVGNRRDAKKNEDLNN